MGVPDPDLTSGEPKGLTPKHFIDVLDKATLTQTGTHFRFDIRNAKTITVPAKRTISQNLILPVQFVFWTAKGKYIEWWIGGVNFHPHYPAVVEDTASVYEETWLNSFGTMCRNGGPANVRHEYGKVYAETWINCDLVPHRNDDLPACITLRNVAPGFGGFATRRLEWHRKGIMYRTTDGPSVIEDRGITEDTHIDSHGMIIRTRKIKEKELIWTNDKGQIHRTTGPATVILKAVTETYKNCDQAPMQYSGWSGSWWVNDECIPNHKLHEWSKRFKVPMRHGPCLTQNAFTTAGGEMYFLSDIAARIGK